MKEGLADEMLKVLHVLKSNHYSGAESVAIAICGQMDSGYRSAYASPAGAVAAFLENAGIQYYPLKKFRLRDIRRVLEEYQPDIVHAHDFSASAICACMNGSFYLISHLHQNPSWIRKWNLRSFAYWLCMGRFSQFLLVSAALLKEAVFLDAGSGKVRVIGNPVDTGRIIRLAEAETADSYDLLFVGRLAAEKNPQKFIRIAAKVKKKGMSIRCAMLGEGELYRPCMKLIGDMGLGGEITMAGFCKNPYPYIKSAKILVITSDWEGYGLAACEASVLGTPVLAGRVGGLETIFAQVPEVFCESENEFAEKIGQLLGNPAEYEKFQKDMKKSSFEGASQYMEQMRQIYQYCVKGE